MTALDRVSNLSSSSPSSNHHPIKKMTLGVLGGSSLLHSTAFQSVLTKEQVETPAGRVELYVGVWRQSSFRLVFIQRHHAQPDGTYAQPANINYHAITLALKHFDCDKVLGVYSVGSLNPSIHVGDLILPDDYFNPFDILPSHSNGFEAHVVPSIDETWRFECMHLVQNDPNTIHASRTVHSKGVYVQARGPRFETKAEIRFFKQMGDVIGMTGAHEASLLNEIGIPFCMLGIVDNLGNGLVGESACLSLEAFKKAQAQNCARMEQAVLTILDGVELED